MGFSVDVGKTSAEGILDVHENCCAQSVSVGVTKAAKEARKEANREPEKKDRKRLWQMRRRRGRGARLSILCEVMHCYLNRSGIGVVDLSAVTDLWRSDPQCPEYVNN